MRCKFCGSTLIHSAHDHRNFSAGKAVAGTIVFGPLGAGAGMLGKDIEGFRCTQCGAFMEHPMDTMTEKMVNDAVYDAKKGTSYISYNFYKGQYPNIETVQVENRNKPERVSLHFSNNTKTVKAINVEKDTMKVKRSFTPNLWEPSCPVFIRSIIIKTGNSGDSLSFDIINQSEKTIRSLYLQATVLDDTGDEITTIQCVFQGENVDPGNTFSSDKAFTVGSDLAYKVEVVCEKAAFTDDSVWRAEDGTQAYTVQVSDIKSFPRFRYLYDEYNKILEERGVVQRDKRGRYIKACRPEYFPIKNESDGYWTCTCGMPVKINKPCPVCKCSYEELQTIFSQDYLAKIQHDAVLQRAADRALETAGFREKLDKVIEEKKAAEYEKALSARESDSISQLTEATGLLDKLGDYKDAKKIAADYRSRLEELKEEEEKKRAEEEKKAAAIAEERAKQAAKEAEIQQQQKERRKKHIIFASVAAIAFIAICAATIKIIIPNNKYNAAVMLMESGDYDAAMEEFEAMGDYKDSAEKIEECKNKKQYEEAEECLNAGEYKEAEKLFLDLNNYSDSSQRASEAKYQYAESLLKNGDYDNAKKTFEELGDYSDASSRAKEVQEAKNESIYASAVTEMEASNYKEAYELFVTIEDYSDSKELAKSCAVSFAKTRKKDGDLDDAIEWYRKAGEEDDAFTIEYNYVKDHYNNDDTNTYRYLLDLCEEKYSDSQKLYDDLYKITIKAIWNSDFKDTTTSLSSIPQKSLSWHCYLHYIFEGGYPGQKVNFTVTEYRRMGANGVARDWEYSRRRGKAEYTVDVNEWHYVAPEHTGSNVYYHRLILTDADTGEEYGTYEIYTPYN